jgi:hypothetical protein
VHPLRNHDPQAGAFLADDGGDLGQLLHHHVFVGRPWVVVLRSLSFLCSRRNRRMVALCLVNDNNGACDSWWYVRRRSEGDGDGDISCLLMFSKIGYVLSSHVYCPGALLVLDSLDHPASPSWLSSYTTCSFMGGSGVITHL